MLKEELGKKILIVDDDNFNIDIMQEYLSLEGYDVIIANDGEDGLKKLEENSDIAVILLDRMLPGIDGVDVVKKIKADKRFCNIPIIMQTAVTSPGRKFEAIDAGVYRYISKPYEDHTLLNLVQEAIKDDKKQLFPKHGEDE